MASDSVVFHSSISITDIDRLEEVFVYLTPRGWEIPEWILKLKEYVIEREKHSAD